GARGARRRSTPRSSPPAGRPRPGGGPPEAGEGTWSSRPWKRSPEVALPGARDRPFIVAVSGDHPAGGAGAAGPRLPEVAGDVDPLEPTVLAVVARLERLPPVHPLEVVDEAEVAPGEDDALEAALDLCDERVERLLGGRAVGRIHEVGVDAQVGRLRIAVE